MSTADRHGFFAVLSGKAGPYGVEDDIKGACKGRPGLFLRYARRKFPKASNHRLVFRRTLFFYPYSLFNYVENDALRVKGTSFVYKMLAEGRLKPRIDRVYPMEQYREAFDYLSRPRENHGKVVMITGL